MQTLDDSSRLSIAVTLCGILTVVAPLCGALFDCGCTWPWSGLAAHCNYFDPLEDRPCPFCDRSAASLPLLALATAVGLAVAICGVFRKPGTKKSVLIDSVGGLLVFAGLTVIGGSLF